MVTLQRGDPVATALVEAIRSGDLQTLGRLLGERPGLAAARIADDKGGSRTPLHIVTDWPGHFLNTAAVVGVLLQAGADPNAPVEGSWHAETPLHWAASSDDVQALDALLDGGADIEAQGASIGGGSPLDDAVVSPRGFTGPAARPGQRARIRPPRTCGDGSARPLVRPLPPAATPGRPAPAGGGRSQTAAPSDPGAPLLATSSGPGSIPARARSGTR